MKNLPFHFEEKGFDTFMQLVVKLIREKKISRTPPEFGSKLRRGDIFLILDPGVALSRLRGIEQTGMTSSSFSILNSELFTLRDPDASGSLRVNNSEFRIENEELVIPVCSIPRRRERATPGSRIKKMSPRRSLEPNSGGVREIFFSRMSFTTSCMNVSNPFSSK